MLDRAETLAVRLHDVLDRHVVLLVEPGPAAAFPDVPEGRDRGSLVARARRIADGGGTAELVKHHGGRAVSVSERRRGREFAVGGAGDGHAGRQVAARNEGGDILTPHRFAAMMAGQVDVRVPAAGNGESVQGDPLAGRQLDALQAAAAPGRGHFPAHQDPRAGNVGRRRAIANVDDRSDVDARVCEIGRGAPAVVVVDEHADAPPGANREAVGICPHRAGQHHAGPVVAAEGDRPFGRAGREDRPPAVDPPQDLARFASAFRQMVGPALQRAVDAVIVSADDRGPQEETDPVHRGQFAHGVCRPVRAGPTVHFMGFGVEPPAHDKILVGQDDPGAAAPGRQRRGKAGRTRADDQQVAMQEALVVAVRISRAGHAAEPGRGPDCRLVDLLPEGLRPHEGLVVEAGRQEGRDQVVCRQQVVAQRTPVVLAERFQPVEQFGDGRPRVRLAVGAGPQLDQRVGLFRAGGEDAARPVVLEAPADQADPVGEQGGRQRIAKMADHLPAVEPERKDAAAVERAAVEPERAAHRSRPRAMATSRASSTLTTSWVSVLRVTTSQERSPCSWNHSSRCSPAGLSRRCW